MLLLSPLIKCQLYRTEAMKISCQKTDKPSDWFWVLLLLQFCPAVMAAEKSVEHSEPVATTTSSEYGAVLKLARFAPSPEQRRAVESLFGQLKERHITIKPSLCKLLALSDSHQLVPLCKKTALFFSHVDNTRIKNSACLSSMIQSKKQIREFIGQEDTGITMLAASPCLSSITGMCSNCLLYTSDAADE